MESSKLEAHAPPVVTIEGRSMEPTLPVGTSVLVRPIEAPPRHGDIVLIRGQARWIVHRVIHADRRSDLVFHSGDMVGVIGTCSEGAVLGFVTTFKVPANTAVPGIESLDAAIRRRLAGARWRCRLFALCRSVAVKAGGERSSFVRSIGRVFRRVVL